MAVRSDHNETSIEQRPRVLEPLLTVLSIVLIGAGTAQTLRLAHDHPVALVAISVYLTAALAVVTRWEIAAAIAIGGCFSIGLLAFLSIGTPMMFLGFALLGLFHVQNRRLGHADVFSNSALFVLFLSTIPTVWILLLAIARS